MQSLHMMRRSHTPTSTLWQGFLSRNHLALKCGVSLNWGLSAAAFKPFSPVKHNKSTPLFFMVVCWEEEQIRCNICNKNPSSYYLTLTFFIPVYLWWISKVFFPLYWLIIISEWGFYCVHFDLGAHYALIDGTSNDRFFNLFCYLRHGKFLTDVRLCGHAIKLELKWKMSRCASFFFFLLIPLPWSSAPMVNFSISTAPNAVCFWTNH